MRKLFLLLSLLPLWGPGGRLLAQSCVSVRQISANYATKQITFDLTWGTCNNTNHLYRVWVFADYQPVVGLIKDVWSRAAITGSSAGTLHGNAGVWITGTAGATQRVTLTVAGAPDQFNWCAVAVDYPPNALINVAGGYTLRGTAPFTVNGSQLGAGIKTYSGACITSITDATGNPEGKVPALPAVTTTNPAAVCAGSGVTLTANVSGGTTTANTYTWNIGGATTTTTTNTFAVPAAPITASKTFTVSVRNANGCTSNTANGSITINSPGANGQSATCGCATGTTNCSGTCRTNSTYTDNNGTCASCNTRYRRQLNQCGAVVNAYYSTFTDASCTTGCAPAGSSVWTKCSGFSAVSNVNSEGFITLSAAETHCSKKGMRLPTITELQCMCTNKTTLPGGYLTGMWSSSRNGYNVYCVNFANCATYANGVPTDNGYFKCVK